MSRRTSRQRQQAMSADRRHCAPRRRAWNALKATLTSGRIWLPTDEELRRELRF